VIQIKSRDANFLEQEFPSKDEIRWDSVLYELDQSTPGCPIEQEGFEPTPPGNSKSSNSVDDDVPPS